jgi:hypothetical protein
VLSIGGGNIIGQTGLNFTTINNLSVRLLPSGVAEVVSLQPTNVTVAANSPPLERTTGNVRISYTNLRLRNNGVLADAKVNLPQGLGFTVARATSGGKFKASLTVLDVVLQSNLSHAGLLSISSLGADAWVFDEARPVLYQVTRFSLSTEGKFIFDAENAEWVHKAAFTQLADQQRDGQHETSDMQTRLSNDGYLRFARAGSKSLVFIQAEDGSARTEEASIELSPGDFRTHMPLDTLVSSSGSENRVEIRDGAVDPDLSRLQVTGSVGVTYLTECTQGDCPKSGASKSASFTPAGGVLGFTPDGGLFAVGTVTSHALQWDRRDDGFFSHETGAFTAASLFIPGHQLYAGASPEAELRAPGAVLYAGFDPQVPGMVYPNTDEYLLGAGAYAGLNFTVANTTNQDGKVRIADMDTSLDLGLRPGVSKYYVRRSGVSGRHVAVTFPPELRLYDYDFDFTKWEMAFLSNGSEPVAEPSRINGQVSVPKVKNIAETEFTQRFKALQIGCKGALGDGEIDSSEAGVKPLSYWDGSFKPLDIRFVGAGGDCAGGRRDLTMMVESGAANISTPLYGSLIFLPNGNLGTLARELPGVDGRLGLPAVVEMKGPGTGDDQEIYKMNPVSKLYFNNPEAPGAPSTGFVGFGARCPVPYFLDLEVHVMTSANRNLAGALVSLTSGWAEGGVATDTFFKNVLFDRDHRGFPDSSHSITADAYRFPLQPDAFTVKARQSIFGLVPLEYPLKWNRSTRDFVGEAPQKVDIVIMNFKHQVDYLSAENLEITFGGQFADLKRLNLSNAVSQGLDRLHDAAHTQVNRGAASLINGVNQLDDLVSDNIDKLINKVTEDLTAQVFDTFYTNLENSYNQHVLNGGPLDNREWMDDAEKGLLKQIHDYVGSEQAGTSILRQKIGEIVSGVNTTASIVNQVAESLDQSILAIDIVCGDFKVDVNNIPVATIYEKVNGLLTPFAGEIPAELLRRGIIREVPISNIPGSPTERQIVQSLVNGLVRASVPENVAPVLEALLAGNANYINDELNGMIGDFDPTLDRLTEALQELKGVLAEVRAKVKSVQNDIGSAQSIAGELQRVVDEKADELDKLVKDAAKDLKKFVEDAATAASADTPLAVANDGLNLLQEFTRDEMRAFLRAYLRDKLMESGLIQNIQHVLRQHIAEVRMAVHSAIDTVYAQLNEMCLRVIKEVLAPLDEEINKAIGPIADVLGAGKVDGYAHIEGDTLRRLRIDAQVELSLPEKMNLKAYFEMMCFDSSTENKGCGPAEPGQQTVEIRIGALDVPLDWSPAPAPPAEEVVEAVPGVEPPDTQRRADIGVLFTIGRANADSPYLPTGIGGSFQMTNGEFDFEGVTVSELSAAVGIGAKPDFSGLNFAYIAATARVVVTSYEGAGGIFFGKTCSLDPLMIVDPDTASVLGQPPFTGAYVYGEVWLPLTEVLLGVPATCMFKISAGVGAGAFYFVEGPTFGGRITLGLSGEALCAVSVRGTVKLLGVVTDGDLIFKGKGNIVGTAGSCPLCLEFDQTLGVTYRQGAWSVDE